MKLKHTQHLKMQICDQLRFLLEGVLGVLSPQCHANPVIKNVTERDGHLIFCDRESS